VKADAAQVQELLCQQTARASFGSFALRERDPHKVLSEAARLCAEGLGPDHGTLWTIRIPVPEFAAPFATM
jgi:hypothetical protein